MLHCKSQLHARRPAAYHSHAQLAWPLRVKCDGRVQQRPAAHAVARLVGKQLADW
jgi:hypothetical protein